MLLAEPLTEQVIGLAIEVHRNTGPGLLEAVYEQCLCMELRREGVAFKRPVPIPILYKGEPVGDDFKADVVVAEQFIVETKSVATILTVHEMQLRTYLRMSGIRVGLLLNFNAPRLGKTAGHLAPGALTGKTFAQGGGDRRSCSPR
jgi:GxxExxY protein